MRKYRFLVFVPIVFITTCMIVAYNLSENQTPEKTGPTLCSVEFVLQSVTPVGLCEDGDVMLTPEKTFFAGGTEYRILQVEPDSTILALPPDSTIGRKVKVDFVLMPSNGIIAEGDLRSFTFLN